MLSPPLGAPASHLSSALGAASVTTGRECPPHPPPQPRPDVPSSPHGATAPEAERPTPVPGRPPGLLLALSAVASRLLLLPGDHHHQ